MEAGRRLPWEQGLSCALAMMVGTRACYRGDLSLQVLMVVVLPFHQGPPCASPLLGMGTPAGQETHSGPKASLTPPCPSVV